MRKLHVYGVGAAKSGTHSLASIFGEDFRVSHEARSQEMIRMILARAAGTVSESALGEFLIQRDATMALDVDSSQLNFLVIDPLVSLFPESRFFLTIRDPYSWLDSLINHQLGRSPAPPDWVRLRDHRFRPWRFVHPSKERILKVNGLYTLDGYLSYWAHHHEKVMASVPAERLLVIRTGRIRESLREIADFLGICEDQLKPKRAHAFKAVAKFGILEQLDQGYLRDKVEWRCGALMQRWFPDF